MTSLSADPNLLDDDFTPPPAAPWDEAFDHAADAQPDADEDPPSSWASEAIESDDAIDGLGGLDDLGDLDAGAARRDADWMFDPAPQADGQEGLCDLDPFDSTNPVGDLIADVEQVMAAPVDRTPAAKAAIHFFRLQPLSGDLVDAVKADRRLAGLSVRVRAGGLCAAVEHYAVEPPPPLVIAESRETPTRLIAMVEALRRLCGPSVKLIVLGESNDVALFRALTRAGADDYLPEPVAAPSLADAIADLRLDKAQAVAARRIAFVGARGGAGSSTLAHNFAYVLAERLQADTLLADFDMTFGTVGLDFDKDPVESLADALAAPDKFDETALERMAIRCSERLSLLGAPARLDRDYEIDARAFDLVMGKMRNAASLLVLDMPSAWSAWKRRALIEADEVVVVATLDLTALRNAKNLIDLLRRSRPRALQPHLVLNQVGVPGRPEVPVKDFCDALGVKAAAVLPFEPRLFGEAANNSRMLAQTAPDSKAARAIEQLAWNLSRREPPPAQKPAFLASLLRRR